MGSGGDPPRCLVTNLGKGPGSTNSLNRTNSEKKVGQSRRAKRGMQLTC